MDIKIAHMMKVVSDPSLLCVSFLQILFPFPACFLLVFYSYSVRVNFRIRRKFRKWKTIDNPVPRQQMMILTQDSLHSPWI